MPWGLLVPLLVGEGVVAAVVDVPPVVIEEGVSVVLLEGVTGLEAYAAAAAAKGDDDDDDDAAAAATAGDGLGVASALVLVCFLKRYGGRPVLTGDHMELESPLSKPPAILRKRGPKKNPPNHQRKEKKYSASPTQ